MTSQRLLLAGTLNFSYGVFLVFDHAVAAPGCAWTEVHEKQGFARRQSTACFATLVQFGAAELKVQRGPYRASVAHERVIQVPLDVRSGCVEIKGPEEGPGKRRVNLPVGHYGLVAAQTAIEEERQLIDLFFELLPEPLWRSRILLADEALAPLPQLLETADETS